MKKDETFALMKKLIREQLDVDEASITEEASFVDDLGADSLALVELVLAFEEHFGVTIPDTVTDKLRTVGDAVTYVVQHASDGRAASARSA
jgi:acyl carrier protein